MSLPDCAGCLCLDVGHLTEGEIRRIRQHLPWTLRTGKSS